MQPTHSLCTSHRALSGNSKGGAGPALQKVNLRNQFKKGGYTQSMLYLLF